MSVACLQHLPVRTEPSTLVPTNSLWKPEQADLGTHVALLRALRLQLKSRNDDTARNLPGSCAPSPGRCPLRKLVLVLALLPSSVAAQDPSLAQSDKADPGIVFVSMRDGIEDIYVMEVDGSNARRVTVTEPVEGEQRGSWVPAWSPDGGRIVFMSNRDGPPEVYVMNADGTDVQRITRLEKGSSALCCPAGPRTASGSPSWAGTCRRM